MIKERFFSKYSDAEIDRAFDQASKELIWPKIEEIAKGEGSDPEIRCEIGQLAKQLYYNEPIPEKNRKLLAYALMEISTGKNADAAFLLKKGHKRKNSIAAERATALPVWHRVYLQGKTINQAAIEVSQDNRNLPLREYLGDRAIRNRFKKHEDEITQTILKILSSNNSTE